jgi:hypothetical protein
VESVLRASRQAADLTASASRSPADHPATSSANKLQTLANAWPDAFACQAIMRDAANDDDDLRVLAKSDYLCEIDGGLRLNATSTSSCS